MSNINYMQVGDEAHCLACHKNIKGEMLLHQKRVHSYSDVASPCTEKCGKYFNWDKQKGSFCEKCGGEMLKWVEDCKFKCVCPQRQKDGSWVEQPTEGWLTEFRKLKMWQESFEEGGNGPQCVAVTDIVPFIRKLLSQAKEESAISSKGERNRLLIQIEEKVKKELFGKTEQLKKDLSKRKG